VALNPALENLRAQLAGDAGSRGFPLLRSANHRTSLKVARILHTQAATSTPDIPSRCLWFTNVPLSKPAFFDYLSQVAAESGGVLKHLLYVQVRGSVLSRTSESPLSPPPHFSFPRGGSNDPLPSSRALFVSAYALFDSSEAAFGSLLAVTKCTWKKLLVSSLPANPDSSAPAGVHGQPSAGVNAPNHAFSAFSVAFGNPLFPTDGAAFEHIRGSISEFAQISGPHHVEASASGGVAHTPTHGGLGGEWVPGLVRVLPDGQLCLFASLQAEPLALLPVDVVQIDIENLWTLKISAGDARDRRIVYYLKFADQKVKDLWSDILWSRKPGSERSSPPSSPSSPALDDQAFALSQCSIASCAQQNQVEALYRLDDNTLACLPCWTSRLTHLLSSDEQVGTVADRFSAQDLRDLLSKSAYSAYLEASLRAVLAAGDNFVTCPSCAVVFEMESGSLLGSQDFLSTLTNADNEPLSAETQEHYLKHRLRCRQCEKAFCTACKTVPYHIGYTCAQWTKSLNGLKCRSCDIDIDQVIA
jgi:hypothetical protein